MILIIQICNRKFHYLEFIKPIEDVLQRNGIEFESIHYKKFTEETISRAKKIIISGTSLKDNEFLEDLDDFNWIREFNKPILGICGGMHILGLIFDGELKKQQEIGLADIKFKEKFLGINGNKQVYELHNFYFESKLFWAGNVLDADFFFYSDEVKKKIYDVFKFMYLHNLQHYLFPMRLIFKRLIELSLAVSTISPKLERKIFTPIENLEQKIKNI